MFGGITKAVKSVGRGVGKAVNKVAPPGLKKKNPIGPSPTLASKIGTMMGQKRDAAPDAVRGVTNTEKKTKGIFGSGRGLARKQ